MIMKTNFILTLLICCFIISCDKKTEILVKKSSGKINTISVIIDDELWNGEIGDSIRNKFASPVIGLPQEEPLFTINQYPTKLLEGFMINSRTILVLKKEGFNAFEIRKNQYASPQNVFRISGKTSVEILALLEKNAPKMIRLIKQTELAESQRINRQSLLNPSRIANKFHVAIQIPVGYTYALQKDNFIWLKKEITGGNTSLLLYQLPFYALKKNENRTTTIIKMRDSIGNLYIRGTEADAKMITEEAYSPYIFKIKLDGNETFETKGTWELLHDYMSGPFINYTIMDTVHHRMLVLEGFCYAPSKEKRDLMHELEAIIKSVKVLKK